MVDNTNDEIVRELQQQQLRGHKRWKSIWMFLTGILMLTLVGIVLTPFTFLLWRKHSKAIKRINQR